MDLFISVIGADNLFLINVDVIKYTYIYQEKIHHCRTTYGFYCESDNIIADGCLFKNHV